MLSFYMQKLNIFNIICPKLFLVYSIYRLISDLSWGGVGGHDLLRRGAIRSGFFARNSFQLFGPRAISGLPVS